MPVLFNETCSKEGLLPKYITPPNDRWHLEPFFFSLMAEFLKLLLILFLSFPQHLSCFILQSSSSVQFCFSTKISHFPYRSYTWRSRWIFHGNNQNKIMNKSMTLNKAQKDNNSFSKIINIILGKYKTSNHPQV